MKYVPVVTLPRDQSQLAGWNVPQGFLHWRNKMGYETKLYIGKSTLVTGFDYKRGEPELDGDSVYRPYLKDENNEFIKSGKKATWFEVMAMIDLCKAGYESEIHKIDKKNTDENHFWYFYENNSEITKDSYGEKLKPVPILTVLEALKKDNEYDPYRRFTWAIALLESMKDDKEELYVLIYGH